MSIIHILPYYLILSTVTMLKTWESEGEEPNVAQQTISKMTKPEQEHIPCTQRTERGACAEDENGASFPEYGPLY